MNIPFQNNMMTMNVVPQPHSTHPEFIHISLTLFYRTSTEWTIKKTIFLL